MAGNKQSKTRADKNQAAVKKTDAREKRAESRKKAEKRASRVKDIVMLIFIAISVLMYVAIFSGSMEWLNTALDFTFGWMKFVAPLILVVLAILFIYHKKAGSFYRRLLSFVLLLFAVSGVFSFLSGAVENGGLLGRLNHLLFHGWLDTAGSTIVNVLFILIALILLLDFSFFTYLKEKSDPNSEANLKRREAYREKREERRLLRENRELLKHQNRLKTIEDYSDRNDEIRRYNDERDKRIQENETRFRPLFGIGDTTLREDGKEEKTADFRYGISDATKQNAELFGKYANSGISSEKKPEEAESGIPAVNFGKGLFQDDPEDRPLQDDIPEMDEEELKKPEKKPLSGDTYEKVIVTANGKILRETVETSRLRDLREENAEKKAMDEALGRTSPKDEDKKERDSKKEYKFPPLRLLRKGSGTDVKRENRESELRETGEKLVRILKTFGIGVTVTDITCGPSVTRYEIQPEVGVKVSRITALTDDIKMGLAAKDIRMEAPIPGKSAIGIEVPNREKTGVFLRDILESDTFRNSDSAVAFALGRDIEGNSIVADIASMPHVLIAGTTGSGKSVCVNTMVMSIIYHARPTEVKMIMIDPKMVEMQVYKGLPHLLLPVITDPKKASLALNWACQEMDRRYETFARYNVRGITGFNSYVRMEQPEENGELVRPMPQIIIFADEMSDMMMVARKEVEDSVIRLAQKARAAGIHLVLATQSPRAEVLTGLIKANVPSRIAFSVSSGLESRIIIDMNGAENLLGRGDMLYLPSGASKPERIQGAFVSDEEIQAVMDYIVENQKNVDGGGIDDKIDLSVPKESAKTASSDETAGGSGLDELFEDCGRFIIDNEKASIGALQRKFSIGFNRAARIMDQLCEAGVVGEEEGTKPRRILMSTIEFDELLKGSDK